MDKMDRTIQIIGGIQNKINTLKSAGLRPQSVIMNIDDALFLANLSSRIKTYYPLINNPPTNILGLPVVINKDAKEIQIGV